MSEKLYNHTLEARKKMSEAKKASPTRFWLGKSFSEEHRRKLSEVHKGKVLSLEQRQKIGLSNLGRKATPETLAKMSKSRKGERSNFWKGGKTAEARLIRSSSQYRIWREEVFKRDDYRCIDCGARSGETGHTVILEADHIYPFSKYPRLRLMLENGRTLCRECHLKTPTHGRMVQSKV